MGRGTPDTRTLESRRAATDEKLFQATLELLRRWGMDAVTIEAVAARSGVAKTTIYRRYSDRQQMLQATLDHCLPEPMRQDSSLESTSPRSALVRATGMMSSAMERYIGIAFAAVLENPQGPSATIIHDRVVRPRIDGMRSFLRACQQAGHVRPDIDEDIVIDMIIGSVGVHYARFGTFDEQWSENFVAHLWPAIAAEE